MRKIIIILLLILLAGFFLSAQGKTLKVPLPELMKPHALAVDENQIYICEGSTVYIYSGRDYKPVKKFGKKGEGPGEFRNRAGQVIIQPDRLLINSAGKVSYFTKDGTFLSEFKTLAADMKLKPLGELFIASRTLMENGTFFVVVNLYDSHLRAIKEIYRIQRGVQVGGKGTTVFAPPLPYYPVKNRILIARGTDLLIEVLDPRGNPLYSITYDYKKCKVSEADKKEVLEYMNTDKEIKSYLEMIKPILFPDYFPAIRNYYPADDRIYVFTYKKTGAGTECLIFTLKGAFLKQVFLPYAYANAIDEYPAAIRDGKLWQLVENRETEEWELHLTTID
jgi:hypothetical protein